MHNWRLTDCCDDTRCEKLIVNEARGINCENRRQTFIRRKWKPLYSSLGLLGPRLHTDNTHNTDNTHQTIWWFLANIYINVIIKMWIWNRDDNNFRWCRTERGKPNGHSLQFNFSVKLKEENPNTQSTPNRVILCSPLSVSLSGLFLLVWPYQGIQMMDGTRRSEL